MQISVVLDRHRDETDLTDLWKLETSGFHLGPFEVLCVGRVQLVITLQHPINYYPLGPWVISTNIGIQSFLLLLPQLLYTPIYPSMHNP